MTSMQQKLLGLAEQIVNSGNSSPELNQQFYKTISNPSTILECLAILGQSNTFAFVYCNNMLKLIQREELDIVSETRSEENVTNLGQVGDNAKMNIFGRIIFALAVMLVRTQKESYLKDKHLINSMIDLVAMCMKSLFEECSYFTTLERIIKIFIPTFQILPIFNNSTETELISVVPRQGIESIKHIWGYQILVKILISMLEYVVNHSSSKTYYEYRRCIYIFRNSYLSHVLFFAVENFRLLFENFDNSQAMIEVTNETIILLESIFMYPFTLGIHEFQVEDDSGDNLAGVNSNDVYFPGYFRHVICDIDFLSGLKNYYCFLLKVQVPFPDKRREIIAITKILGRICLPSQYTFKNEPEKEVTRGFALEYFSHACYNFTYMDFYYLNNIMDVMYRMLSMYDNCYNNHKALITESSLNFLFQVVQGVEIVLEEGRKNPFSRVFELLSLCIESINDYENDAADDMRKKSQSILEAALSRIVSGYADKVVGEMGYDHSNEIECFKELFQFILPAFELNLSKNLANFNALDLSQLSQGSCTMILHLCSQLLPKTTANKEQTETILKYYELARGGQNLACLRYITTLLTQLLYDLKDGSPAPDSLLWQNMELSNFIDNSSFDIFLKYNIQLCISNFRSNKSQIIDYSLELFKTIYTSLKKQDHYSFQKFYNLVRNLLDNINQTIFVNPNFYHKRRDFFNIIAIIWVNSDNIDYIYKIYSLVQENIKTNLNENTFYQYLNDVTGLVQPIDVHQSFQIMVELMIDDLDKLFKVYLADAASVAVFFQNPHFMKLFCKLAYALVNDLNRKLFFETHTKIPLLIHKLLKPILNILAQGGYEYHKSFTLILEKVINLHPLEKLICFSNIAEDLKGMNKEHFDRLLRAYFDHIHRVEDIEWLYKYIQNSAEFMVSWWEEVMMRNLHPKIDISTIADSRFWNTTRQKETFAKLVFELGYYHNTYWKVDASLTERTFVEQFCQQYG